MLGERDRAGPARLAVRGRRRPADVLREGKRNPRQRRGEARDRVHRQEQRRTARRQSNVRNGNGGGAVYGCRSKTGREPCIRANNLNTGRAFEFETNGTEGGRIEVEDAGARPFTTNATGVATGFNADRVDGLDAGGSTSGRRPGRRRPTSSTSAA